MCPATLRIRSGSRIAPGHVNLIRAAFWLVLSIWYTILFSSSFSFMCPAPFQNGRKKTPQVFCTHGVAFEGSAAEKGYHLSKRYPYSVNLFSFWWPHCLLLSTKPWFYLFFSTILIKALHSRVFVYKMSGKYDFKQFSNDISDFYWMNMKINRLYL